MGPRRRPSRDRPIAAHKIGECWLRAAEFLAASGPEQVGPFGPLCTCATGAGWGEQEVRDGDSRF
jgi:hypothetical protein